MYSVLNFGNMAMDGVRMDAYARAIAATVKPGSVVVDLGAGTGILSLLALKAGARRVHAVDLNSAVWLLRDIAAENGFADRIEVHHKSSWDLELPERANVIISDLRGRFPLFDGHVSTLADVRSRWLAEGGTLLPAKDELRVALVEAPNIWAQLRVALVEAPNIWAQLEPAWLGFERRGYEARAARASTLNTVYSDGEHPIATSQVLSTTAAWGEIVYGQPLARTLERTVEVTATRSGTTHGLAVWFDATLVGDIGFTNAPGHKLVYGRTFLPLLEPLALERGDAATLTLRVDVRGTRWAWDTEVRHADGRPKTRRRQATFLGRPTSPEEMLRESTAYTPAISDKGMRVRRLLESMDGRRTVQELAGALHAEGRAPEDELEEIRELVARYGR